ncbi:hypothetical protein SDC9_194005 [bioreactor metagenome]|uniref:Uncharacterized protein n=1 Tax=bioreactor metagenome TaxID=1076179 RepID=A0A645I7Q5_9ZZZZ
MYRQPAVAVHPGAQPFLVSGGALLVKIALAVRLFRAKCAPGMNVFFELVAKWPGGALIRQQADQGI